MRELEEMLKYCPDLTTKEEVKAMMIGNGDFTRAVLHVCIEEKCVAYKGGYCLKYENIVKKKNDKSLETRKELDKDSERDMQDSEWKRNFMKRFERRC